MKWEGEGSYYYTDVLGVAGLITREEPDFDLHIYGDNGSGGIGAEMTGNLTRNTPHTFTESHNFPAGDHHYSLTNDGTEIATLYGPSGTRFVKIELDHTDGNFIWKSLTTFKVGATLTPQGRLASPAVSMIVDENGNATEVGMVDFTIGINWSDTWIPFPTGVSSANRDWWGNGYYGGKNVQGTMPGAYAEGGYAGVAKAKSDAGDVSGFRIDYYNPYKPKGDLTRIVDLLEMQGADGDGEGFEKLELRYKQNFLTETVGSDPRSNDKKIIEESSSGGNSWSVIDTDSRSNSSTLSSGEDPAQLEDVNGVTWQSRKIALNNNDWNTTEKQINFKFEAGDQYLNETKGWNVDNVEVVARGVSVGELVSPSLDLSKYTTATLKYDSRFGSGMSTGGEKNFNQGVSYDTTTPDVAKDRNDVAETYYSIDGGATWYRILNRQGQERDAGNNAVNAEGKAYGQGWVNNEIDLSCASGQSDVRVKFVFTTDSDNNAGDGWNIDNVDIFGKKSALTDFYMYKQTLNDEFVVGTTNQEEGVNTNRPNISFDPRGTNSLGKYTIDNGRVNISNTDTPMFANTFLTYVEQNAANYNIKKQDSSGQWMGEDEGPVLVVNKYGTITYTTDINFTPDALGRLYNGEGNMYIDEAMAINLGLAVGKEPTKDMIGSKTTGWVNFDTTDGGLKYIAGTCFDEGASGPGTYANMTTYAKQTIFHNGATTGKPNFIEIDADDNVYYM
jgi:hypothetical protein